MTITAKRRRSSDLQDEFTQQLPEGTLACRSCGNSVTLYADTPVETLTIFGQRNQLGFGTDLEIRVARCRTCAARRERAADILRAHPAIVRENGNVGLDRLDAAMSVLDLLGRSKLESTFAKTDAGVRELIETFAALGGWCSWSRVAAPRVSGTRRWGHLPANLQHDSQVALGNLIGRRLEQAKPITPPSGAGVLRGCGFCGIGSLVGKESSTGVLWGLPQRMPLASLGGRGSETILAHLCPTCRQSLAVAGAMGLPAVWLAAIRSRGFEPRSIDTIVAIDGLVPWAVLPGAEPNTSPWAHIKLEALDRELQFSTFVRRRVEVVR